MAKLTELGPFTGTGELYQMLDLVRNKDLYEKRLAEMEALRDKVNDSIKSLGIGRNIESLNSQAQADRRVAGELLEKAKKEAATVYDETRDRRQQLRDDLVELQNTIDGKKKELARVTKEASSVLGDAQAEADALIRQATTERQEAQSLVVEASKLRELHETKRRKVEELIGKFGGV